MSMTRNYLYSDRSLGRTTISPCRIVRLKYQNNVGSIPDQTERVRAKAACSGIQRLNMKSCIASALPKVAC